MRIRKRQWFIRKIRISIGRLCNESRLQYHLRNTQMIYMENSHFYGTALKWKSIAIIICATSKWCWTQCWDQMLHWIVALRGATERATSCVLCTQCCLFKATSGKNEFLTRVNILRLVSEIGIWFPIFWTTLEYPPMSKLARQSTIDGIRGTAAIKKFNWWYSVTANKNISRVTLIW